MTRAIFIVAALLLVALLVVLTPRVEDQPEQVETRVTTSTTAWPSESVPDLGDGFGQLVKASKHRTHTHRRPESVRMKSVPAGAVPDIIRRVFARFGAVVAEQAVRVAACESKFDPNARLGQHLGIFQISRTYHEARVRRLGFSWEQMAQAEPNALVAADIFSESGWGPWTCRWAA